MFKNEQEELRRRAPKVAGLLGTVAFPYRIIPADSTEAAEVVRWIETRFPMLGERIDWSKVPLHECAEWSETTDLLESYARLTPKAWPESEVIVTWADGACPSIALRLWDLRPIAPEVFEADFDTWIVCRRENWCIEVHHDGTLCLGKGSEPPTEHRN